MLIHFNIVYITQALTTWPTENCFPCMGLRCLYLWVICVTSLLASYTMSYQLQPLDRTAQAWMLFHSGIATNLLSAATATPPIPHSISRYSILAAKQQIAKSHADPTWIHTDPIHYTHLKQTTPLVLYRFSILTSSTPHLTAHAEWPSGSRGGTGGRKRQTWSLLDQPNQQPACKQVSVA